MLLERLIAAPLLGLFLVLAGSIAARLLHIALPSSSTDPESHGSSSVAEQMIERAVLGCALLIVILFALASIGGYRPSVLLALCVAVAVAGVLIVRSESGSRVSTAHLPSARLPSWTFRATVTALACLLAVLWLQSTRPDIAWDSNVYHLTVPKLMLESGGFLNIPLNVYSHWPHAVELLFGLCMAVHDYVLAKQLHFVFGVLILIAFFIHSKHARPQSASELGSNNWTALLACGLFLANPVVLFEIRIAYVDVALAFFLVVAFVVAERLIEQARPSAVRADCFLLGIACGLICATKLSGVFLAATVLLVFAIAVARRQGMVALVKQIPLIAIPILVLSLPWPAKSWILTGNPAYPLLFDQFGGIDWSAALSVQHAEWQASIGRGRELIDYLLLPWRVITQGGVGYENFDGQLHLVWLAVIPVAFLAARRNAFVARAIAVITIYFAIWAVTSQQIRFLIPLLALGSLAGARALRDLTLERPRLIQLLPIAAVASIGLSCWSARPYVEQTPRLASDLWSLGYDSKQAVIHPIYGVVDALPESSKLLLLNTNHTFHLSKPALADSFFEASQIIDLFAEVESPDQALALLRQRGVTHVLVEQRHPGMPYPQPLINLLEDSTRVAVLHRSEEGRYVLLTLRPET